MVASGGRTFSHANYRRPLAAGKPEAGRFGDFACTVGGRLPGVTPSSPNHLSRLAGRRQSLSRARRYLLKRGMPFFVSSR